MMGCHNMGAGGDTKGAQKLGWALGSWAWGKGVTMAWNRGRGLWVGSGFPGIPGMGSEEA